MSKRASSLLKMDCWSIQFFPIVISLCDFLHNASLFKSAVLILDGGLLYIYIMFQYSLSWLFIHFLQPVSVMKLLCVNLNWVVWYLEYMALNLTRKCATKCVYIGCVISNQLTRNSLWTKWPKKCLKEELRNEEFLQQEFILIIYLRVSHHA